MMDRHIRADIKRSLAEAGVDCNEQTILVSDIALRACFDNLIDYTNDMSAELMSRNLHSEAMTSGTIANKLKELRDKI